MTYVNDSLMLVGIVEDNYRYAKMLEQTLQLSPDLSIVGVWQDAETALMEVPQQLPDILLIDIQLPGMNGIECIRKMKMISPGIQFLVLTQCADDENIFEALRAGAAGYLLKGEANETLVKSLRELWAGGSPMSRQVARRVVRFFNQPPVTNDYGDSLTRREQEVLSLLAEGRMYKEVSVKLSIAMETTKKHIRNIYGKLQVQNRMEAVNKWRTEKTVFITRW
jgi:DNA-binding NarL/FixJ family response regulator